MANTKRTRRVHAHAPLDGFASWHLQSGDCLIGWALGQGCGVCSTVSENPAVHPSRILRMDVAREIWQHHRASIIAEWTEQLDKAGAPGFPCFAECLFDEKPLPPVRAFWNERARDLHHMVECNLYTLTTWLEEHRD